MVRSSRFALVIAGLVIAGFAAPAVAGNNLFPDTQRVVYGQKKQEFGSGWYIRGSAAWSRDKVPALFSTGVLGNPTIRPDNMWNVSIGFGYKINNWFRTDVTLGYREEKAVNTSSAANIVCPLEVRGVDQIQPDGSTIPIGIAAVENLCSERQQATLRRGTLLFNAYLDLGTWGGVTPFVGAGIGAAYGRVRATYNWYDSSNNLPYTATLVMPGGYPINWLPFDKGYQFGEQSKVQIMNKNQLNLAWAVMAGFAFDVSPHAKLEFSYRYLNLGKWGQATSANVAQDYRIGFRYMID